MYLLKEFHTDIKRLSDLLLWGGMVHGPEPTVLVNKDGTYQTTLRYRGHDVSRWPSSSAWSICTGSIRS